MGVTEDWNEVDGALRDESLYKADIKTLKRYLRAVSNPPPSTNAAFHARLAQAGETIRHLISQKENQTQLGLSIWWAKAAALAAIIGVVLMLLQLLISLRG